MGNVVDYVRREFHGFAELPFGDVDSLVLFFISSITFPNNRIYSIFPCYIKHFL